MLRGERAGKIFVFVASTQSFHFHVFVAAETMPVKETFSRAVPIYNLLVLVYDGFVLRQTYSAILCNYNKNVSFYSGLFGNEMMFRRKISSIFSDRRKS